MKKMLFIGLVTFVLSGCVYSGKYNLCVQDLAKSEKNNQNLVTKLNEKSEEINKLNDQVNQLTENLNKCIEEKKQLGLTLENCNNDKNSLSEKKEALEKEVQYLNNTLSAKKDELTKNIVELKNKLENCEKTTKELENKTIHLNNELQNKNLTINDLKKELKELSTEKAKIMEEKEKAILQLKNTYNSLVSELNEEIKKGEIAVTQLRDKLTLQMVEKILFDSGSAEIKGSGKKIIDRVATILKNVTNKQIRIEGHTDNVPIGPKIAKKFPTNWELSTARATTVVRYLIEKGGIDPKLLSAVGYADTMPVASNETEEGRAKNRRIEIVLSSIDFEKTEK